MEAGTKKENKMAVWFDGLKSEFAKISWPDKKTLTRQTVAVIVVSVALGLIISILDTLLEYGMQLIVYL
jgi:preprotein translocase subunit SecE